LKSDKIKKRFAKDRKSSTKASKQKEFQNKSNSGNSWKKPPLYNNTKVCIKISKNINTNLFSEINIILHQSFDHSSLIPPTNIRIIHRDYNKYSFHYLNILFRLINEFGSIFAKSKESSLPLNRIISLVNFFQINLSLKDITSQNLRNKEFVNKIKEKLLLILYRSINCSNQFLFSSSQSHMFKSYIEKGNNGTLIMHLLKQRLN